MIRYVCHENNKYLGDQIERVEQPANVDERQYAKSSRQFTEQNFVSEIVVRIAVEAIRIAGRILDTIL